MFNLLNPRMNRVVLTNRIGPWLSIRLNRPEHLNAVNTDVAQYGIYDLVKGLVTLHPRSLNLSKNNLRLKVEATQCTARQAWLIHLPPHKRNRYDHARERQHSSRALTDWHDRLARYFQSGGGRARKGNQLLFSQGFESVEMFQGNAKKCGGSLHYSVSRTEPRSRARRLSPAPVTWFQRRSKVPKVHALNFREGPPAKEGLAV